MTGIKNEQLFVGFMYSSFVLAWVRLLIKMNAAVCWILVQFLCAGLGVSVIKNAFPQPTGLAWVFLLS